jgi:hypothetical protein
VGHLEYGSYLPASEVGMDLVVSAEQRAGRRHFSMVDEVRLAGMARGLDQGAPGGNPQASETRCRLRAKLRYARSKT